MKRKLILIGLILGIVIVIGSMGTANAVVSVNNTATINNADAVVYADGNLYIGTSANAEVYVLDPLTLQQTDTIPIDSNITGVNDMAYDASTNSIYVADLNNGVTRFSTATHTADDNYLIGLNARAIGAGNGRVYIGASSDLFAYDGINSNDEKWQLQNAIGRTILTVGYSAKHDIVVASDNEASFYETGVGAWEGDTGNNIWLHRHESASVPHGIDAEHDTFSAITYEGNDQIRIGEVVSGSHTATATGAETNVGFSHRVEHDFTFFIDEDRNVDMIDNSDGSLVAEVGGIGGTFRRTSHGEGEGQIYTGNIDNEYRIWTAGGGTVTQIDTETEPADIVTDVTLNIENQIMEMGSTQPYTVDATFGNGSTIDVTNSNDLTVSSTDSKYVGVDEPNNQLIAKTNIGTADIIANYDGTTDTVGVGTKGTKIGKGIALTVPTFMQFNETNEYTVYFLTENETSDITDIANVSSDNTTRLTVDEPNNTVSSHHFNGTVNLTAEFNGTSVTSEIMIQPDLTLEFIDYMSFSQKSQALLGYVHTDEDGILRSPLGQGADANRSVGGAQDGSPAIFQWIILSMIIGALASWLFNSIAGIVTTYVMIMVGWGIGYMNWGIPMGATILVITVAILLYESSQENEMRGIE